MASWAFEISLLESTSYEATCKLNPLLFAKSQQSVKIEMACKRRESFTSLTTFFEIKEKI